MHRTTACLTLFAAACALVMGVGCEMQRRVVKPNPWDKMFRNSEWYDPSASTGGSSDPSHQRNRGYAVQLVQYSGGEAFRNVPTVIREAREQAGLANLWYASNAGTTTVYVGRFRDPDSPEARAALRQARNAEINGKTPYEDAEIVALITERGEALDPRDLRTLKGRGLFALQIGYFDSNYGTDFRKAAEDKVDQLNKRGEDAYYYHGPNRSMVLVNAWPRNQAFTRVGNIDRYSNLVRTVQEKYPHNVPNARPFTDDDDPQYVKTQRSFLVPIR